MCKIVQGVMFSLTILQGRKWDMFDFFIHCRKMDFVARSVLVTLISVGPSICCFHDRVRNKKARTFKFG